MNLKLLQTIRNNKRILAFIVLFFVALLVFIMTFELIMNFYAHVFLKTLSFLTYYSLKVFGMDLKLDRNNLYYGYCDLIFTNRILRINYGCVGIYALFILLSGIIAYPSSLKSKLAGIIVSLPAFYLYSFLRLVIMGVAGTLGTKYLNFFHSYFMLVINVAFILFLFIIWIEKIRPKYDTQNTFSKN